MSSQSLLGLLAGIDEVKALRSRYPVPRGGIASGVEAVAAKAHGRACVVLLSSHLERYVHAVNEEAMEWLNRQSCSADRFSDDFLLTHSRGAIDDLSKISWNKRGPALRKFVVEHAAFWGLGSNPGTLQHEQLLVWMKAPKPESLIRFYRLYGINNVFNSVTRKQSTRGVLYLGIRELVEKRNNIAHGDAQTEALPTDVTRYLYAVSKFSSSADGFLARALRTITASHKRPW